MMLYGRRMDGVKHPIINWPLYTLIYQKERVRVGLHNMNKPFISEVNALP